MLKVVVPVDGSDNSDRAVKHVITLIKGREPMEVHLLNVQETVDALEIKRFMTEDEIQSWQHTHGEELLESAKTLLDEAGVPYCAHVLIGGVAHTIADFAGQIGADKIIMGTRGLGPVEGLLLGSVATKVIHLAEMPVTLVK